MYDKRSKDREYYQRNREERIQYSKDYWAAKAKAYKVPDLEGEEWLPLIVNGEHYQGSNQGRIKSTWHMKERIIGGCLDKDGYIKITLTNPDRSQTTYRRARLIALTWIPNPDNKPEIDHINTDRTDDRVENLRWASSSENQRNPETLRHMSEWQKGKTKAEVRRKQL